MQTSDFGQMRALAKKCADVPAVVRHAKTTAVNIYNAMKFLKFSDADIASRLHVDDATSAGQVPLTHVLDLIKLGTANLRELMTLKMNFAMRNCDIIWMLMVRAHKNQLLPLCVNKSYLLKKIKVIEAETNVRFDTLISLCASSSDATCKVTERLIYKKNGFPLECHLASMSHDGSVRASRMLKPDLRIPRRKNAMGSKRVIESDVYPPLSEREKAFVTVDPSGHMEWTTGYMYWNIHPDKKTNEYNLFTYLANKFGREIVCGPSGNTDSSCETDAMFHNGTKKSLVLGVLACIGWMCNPPDHSPYEILIAAVPFGLPYSIDKDPYEFTKGLLLSVSP